LTRLNNRTALSHLETLRRLLAVTLLVLSTILSWPAEAEHFKIGVLRLGQAGPVYIAQDKGYFAAEGLDTEVVLFDAAQPIAVAVASGDLAFGATALTAGLYSLGGQGALRIVAGMNRYNPGFHSVAYLVSNRAWDGGLKSFKEFGGRAVAVTQIGSGYHYSLALITAKYGVDLKSIRVLPVQTMPNIASALIGGQTDAALLATTPATPLIERHDAHLLGWVDDETPWQNGAVFVATKTATERRDLVDKFLRAFRKGTREYHDAFTGPGEKPMAGPNVAEVAGFIAKYTGEPIETAMKGDAYVDADARLDVKDVLHQIDWYIGQNMIKGPIDGAAMIDKSYVKPLP
jgi:NitT/TauT family transport system substrate-binding protein